MVEDISAFSMVSAELIERKKRRTRKETEKEESKGIESIKDTYDCSHFSTYYMMHTCD